MPTTEGLHNNHNVYIFGAGFSCEAGYPVLNDFLNRARDAQGWLDSNGSPHEANAIDRVLKFRRDAANSSDRIVLNLENIEDLLSLAELSDEAEPREAMIAAIGGTLRFCDQTIPRPPKYRLDLSHGGGVVPEQWELVLRHDGGLKAFQVPTYDWMLERILRVWRRAPEPREDTIITFNYDLVIEQSLKRLRAPIYYGLPTERTSFHVDTVKPQRDQNTVPVFKLHGSLNWTTNPADPVPSVTVHHEYQGVTPGTQAPLLVPPTWSKARTPHLVSVWREAAKALETATRICIVGYSIPPTDLYFKYLLGAALRRNVSLRKVVIVDPNESQAQARAKLLFRDTWIDSGRVRFFKNTTSEAFSGDLGSEVLRELERPLT